MDRLIKIEVINDFFPVPELPIAAESFDHLMACGWRLIGSEFVRHNIVEHGQGFSLTIPLRVRLSEGFQFSKSQRKLLKQNTARFRTEIGRIELSEEKFKLFKRHSQRFEGDRYPPPIEVFMHELSNECPVPGIEFDVFDGEQLVAVSFVHAGATSLSSTYCIYDPTYQKFSLGHYTMLLEIMYSMHTGRQFYYPGYAYAHPSRMDYKKNFHQLERFDWKTNNWWAVERNFQ